jgi:hypothetical protein
VPAYRVPFNRFQNQFKLIRTISKPFKFDRLKKDLPKIKKFEIKYGFEGFEEWNNFIHRNVFRLEMFVELKIWESMSCF